MAAPSPSTNPSRSLSNGREAFVGSSLRVLSAVSRLKPVTPNGWIMLCVPPESMTSASPRRMISVASPMAWLLAAQAVRQLRFGPCALNMRRPDARPACAVLVPIRSWDGAFPVLPGELRDVEPVAVQRLGDHVGETVEILLPFAAAEIHAEPGGVADAVDQAGAWRSPAWPPPRQTAYDCCDNSNAAGPRRHRKYPNGGLRPRSAWGNSRRRSPSCNRPPTRHVGDCSRAPRRRCPRE